MKLPRLRKKPDGWPPQPGDVWVTKDGQCFHAQAGPRGEILLRRVWTPESLRPRTPRLLRRSR